MPADGIGPVAGTVAHQLGTYAVLLSAHAGELADGNRRSVPLADSAAAIQHSAAGIRRVTDDLLDLARMDAMPPEPAEVEPAELLAAAARRLEVDPAADGGVGLQVGELPRAVADPILLTKAFVHLLRVAASASDRPGAAGVVVAGAPRDGRCHIVLADDGPQLDEERLATLFDPGVPPRGRGPLVGAGVGLVIVRELVTRLDGRVHAQARTGAPGVEVHLELPGVPA